jgi:uncharacterized membrane protein
VSTYQWLLALHVTSAFLLLGGATIGGIFSLLAWKRERPSEVVLLMRLTQIAVVAIMLGVAGTLVFGLWLVHETGYGWGDGWIVAALLLWLAGSALGGIGGNREKETRQLGERLAAEGDAPSSELSARLRDPVTNLLSWGSGVAMLLVLVLMIWKPGA